MRWILLLIWLSSLSFDQARPNKIFEYDDFINYLYDEFNNSAQLQGEPIGEECTQQMQFWVWTLNNRPQDIWAAKMFDAWGKFQSGVLSGNTHNWGHYESCLRIQHQSEQFGSIQGQHCVIQYHGIETALLPQRSKFVDSVLFPDGIPDLDHIRRTAGKLQSGVCVPKSCSPREVHTIMTNFLLDRNFVTTPFEENRDEIMMCNTKDGRPLRTIDVVAIVIFGFITALMIFSTIYEAVVCKLDIRPNDWFSCFSIVSNSHHLFNINQESPPIASINGIRALSAIWIVMGHRYAIYFNTPIINRTDIAIVWMPQLLSGFVNSFTFAVDSFLLLGGFLVAKSLLKEFEEKQKFFNILHRVLHRFLRITPAYAAMILFIVSIAHHMGDGPFFKPFMKQLSKSCENNWWTALLYVQNYANPLELCLTNTWYLSVDMQLFILSPFVIYPLWKFRKYFIPVIAVFILLQILCVFTTVYLNNFKTWGAANDLKDELQRLRLIMWATHSRYGVYLVGIILGFIFFELKGRKYVIPFYAVAISWTLSISTFLIIIFGMYRRTQPNYYETALESAFYQSMTKVVWGIAIAWIIFSCQQRQGYFIRRFLELPIFQVISKLSFSMGLTHVVIQIILVASQRQPGLFQDNHLIHQFLGDLGFTLTMSVYWYLAFESPIMRLEKLINRECASLIKPNTKYNIGKSTDKPN